SRGPTGSGSARREGDYAPRSDVPNWSYFRAKRSVSNASSESPGLRHASLRLVVVIIRVESAADDIQRVHIQRVAKQTAMPYESPAKHAEHEAARRTLHGMICANAVPRSASR